MDELDEATRQFNFWTHQLHIFFVRKFFPAAHKLLFLKQLVRERYSKCEVQVAGGDTSLQAEASSLSTVKADDTVVTDRGFEPVIEEEGEEQDNSVPPISVAT